MSVLASIANKIMPCVVVFFSHGIVACVDHVLVETLIINGLLVSVLTPIAKIVSFTIIWDRYMYIFVDNYACVPVWHLESGILSW